MGDKIFFQKPGYVSIFSLRLISYIIVFTIDNSTAKIHPAVRSGSIET